MSGWREKLLTAIEPLDPYLADRVLVVSGLYLLSFLILDVILWKACVLTLAVYGLLILQIWRRAVEAICIVLFAAAMAKWTDIAGINEVATTAHQALQNLARR
jgi:hypothetical protein